jgi:hypothetical protein
VIARAFTTMLLCALVGTLAGCGEVAESQPLPWLRVKKTQGGWTGNAEKYDYYVKRLGFAWVKLDEAATGQVIPLDPDTAAISTAQGVKLLYRGEDQGTLVCGSNRSAVSIVREAAVIDCIDTVGAASANPSQIRWRRISVAGEALAVERLGTEAPDRIFARAAVSFYDPGHQPYFVTLRADPARPECALVWAAGDERRSLPAPEGMNAAQCADPGEWSKLLRRTLRRA